MKLQENYAMNQTITINNLKIGRDQPCYIVAEMSANHMQKIENAIEIIREAKQAGADAVKVQLYTPDTMTINCNKPDFFITGGLWPNWSLYELYDSAFMPWGWYPDLQNVADINDITLFPTVYDMSSLAFAESMNVPVYKIASFEIGYVQLLDEVAKTGKPTIVSLGKAQHEDIVRTHDIFYQRHNENLMHLKCTSEYPAEIDLNIFDDLKYYNMIMGLSDHSKGIGFPIYAVMFGAKIIEKHIKLPNTETPDSEFSLIPDEFKSMVDGIRGIEHAMSGNKKMHDTKSQTDIFCRSIYAVKNIKQGESFTVENVRIIRPSYGLPPCRLNDVLKAKASRDIERGTAISEELLNG